MNQKVQKLLNHQGGNHILPFFWQHGEDEQTLRTYMKVIDESNIGAVCIESRPHPDYCGPQWWHDMDIILDEARKRDMKVWILDDSHFPTGFANGAMKDQPDELCRQSICCRKYDLNGLAEFNMSSEEVLHPVPFELNMMEAHNGDTNDRVFDDDRLLGIYAVRVDTDKNGFTDDVYCLNLTDLVKSDTLNWSVPEGHWKVYAIHLSRNYGHHRNYINMMDYESCRVLIDTVYEPHYAHYKDDFGKTIVGFFSDEPEFGNWHMFDNSKNLGDEMDFPWSREAEAALTEKLGADFAAKLIVLWENDADAKVIADVRYTYMDTITRLVEKDFSYQLGDWCRDHGVKYIGHIIEDNNQHARTVSSLGHYFRSLAGQDMAGIDDIGGQVLPQQEDVDVDGQLFGNRIGEFYHYMLGKLGNSAAAIEPLKHGDAMCEIFGAYGWSEGVRLEKYLTDHFCVRGINKYVPHAFTPKAFPDPDCPPHFYAHGHNPQYRHFGALMAYMNRVCELISDGIHLAPAAVLYHGESEWMGKSMYSHVIGHVLADAQIDYDFLPQDVFTEVEKYRVDVADGCLKVNTQSYKVLIVPQAPFVTADTAAYITKLQDAGVQVWFVNSCPDGVDGTVVTVDEIVPKMNALNMADVSIAPADNRVRYYHYVHEDKTNVYMFVNEGTKDYCGEITLAGADWPCHAGTCYVYNAWDNCLEPAAWDGKTLKLTIEPLKSQIVIFDISADAEDIAGLVKAPAMARGEMLAFDSSWKRSLCRSIDYPHFGAEKEVALPDQLASEEPIFSGFVRYTNTLTYQGGKVVLKIDDAYEGVEVFVNKKSLGIQIAPPFVYDITDALITGTNEIAIEVATTLEREMSTVPNMFGMKAEPKCLSGITGDVRVFVE